MKNLITITNADTLQEIFIPFEKLSKYQQLPIVVTTNTKELIISKKEFEQLNYIRASELKNMANSWVERTFNYIQLNTITKCLDDMLFEHIEPEPIEELADKFLFDYSIFDIDIDIAEVNEQTDVFEDIEDFDNWLEDNEEKAKNILEESAHDLREQLIEYLSENHEDELREKYEDSDSNYPMWGTLFEWRKGYDDNEENNQRAQKAGFGILNSNNYFNSCLFVSGAGYSFYGQHWIPLFLSMPYNSDIAKEYKGVNYSMV